LSSGRRVAVIGAGLAGLWTAYHLAQRGYEVTVYEKEYPGYGASSRAAGILSLQLPVPLLKYAMEAIDYYSWVGVRETPTIWVPRRELCRCAEAVAAELRRLGAVAEVMKLDEVDGLLRGEGERAIFMMQGIVNAGDAVNALTKVLAEKGATFRGGQVTSRGGRLYFNGSPIEAEAYFVAAGPWTPSLVKVDLRLYRCSAHSVEGERVPNMIVEDDVNEFYVVPESGKRAIVGGPDSTLSRLEDGFRYEPSEPYEVLERVSRRMPVAELMRPVSSWSAPCTSGPDGLPVVGEVDDRVYVIAGLDGAGLTLSPALSRLLVEIAEGAADEDLLLSPARKALDGPLEPFDFICVGLS
jgi:Glycine/D-amino acid oxidases (deaminating)